MGTGRAIESRPSGCFRRRKKKVKPVPPSLPEPVRAEEPPQEELPRPEIPEPAHQTELEHLREKWPELVEQCLVLQPALKRDLRDSWPLILTETQLTIGFDPEFPGTMAEVKMLDHGGLHSLFSKLLGRSVGIEYQVMKEAVTWSHHSPDEEASPVEDQPFSVENAGNNPEEWVKNDSVRQVLEVFHGDIIDIQH